MRAKRHKALSFSFMFSFMCMTTDMPSLIADRRHSLFGHICRLPENTPASQALQLSIEAHTGTPPAADWRKLSKDGIYT